MDEERIEEGLRRGWSLRPPDGMRERVLARSREELARRREDRRPTGLRRWQLACAALGALWILLAGAADTCRQARVSAMVGSPGTDGQALLAMQRAQRLRMEAGRSLAWRVDGRSPRRSRTGGAL